MSSTNYDAFISYASADLAIGQVVFERLRGAGFEVWFDRDRLKLGFDWHREIEARCEASLVMLPILTPRWRQSLWTCYETYGHEAIIPMLFEGGRLKLGRGAETWRGGRSALEAPEGRWNVAPDASPGKWWEHAQAPEGRQN